MWIYFVEQVWSYNPDDWSKLGWETHELQTRWWEHWHYHEFPDGTPAYKQLTTYEGQEHMVEGNDYVEF